MAAFAGIVRESLPISKRQDERRKNYLLSEQTCRCQRWTGRITKKQITIIELAEPKVQAISAAGKLPAVVVDPTSNVPYVLLRQDVYLRLTEQGEPAEWQSVYRVVQNEPPPHQSPSLRDLVPMIAPATIVQQEVASVLALAEQGRRVDGKCPCLVESGGEIEKFIRNHGA